VDFGEWKSTASGGRGEQSDWQFGYCGNRPRRQIKAGTTDTHLYYAAGRAEIGTGSHAVTNRWRKAHRSSAERFPPHRSSTT
jgi:hypothetical protein